MLSSLLSSASALYWTLAYSRRLRLSNRELLQLVKKSVNLGLCYGAFSQPIGGFTSAYRAGMTAFCCAAYDVVTDWRHFDPRFREPFFSLLRKRVPGWAVALTEDLYERELRNTLSMDGLERGVIAVEFVTGIIGSRPYYSQWGLSRLGVFCQVVDDILDEAHDLALGELNCLHTVRRAQHLANFFEVLPDARRLFGDSPVMQRVLDTAQRRALSMAATPVEIAA